MSKAFTKEENTDAEDDQELPSVKLPSGSKNYITPGGEKKLRDELRHLLNKLRPETTEAVTRAAANGDRSENGDYIYNKKRLREIDRRIRFLTKRLEAVEIIDPSLTRSDKVHFGATVVIREEDGEDKTYSIVGVDETQVKRGWISWISPLGALLLNKRVGDVVTLRLPSGDKDIEIVSIRYEPLGTSHF